MKYLFLAFLAVSLPAQAQAFEVFNLNVFDQLQGSWDAGFRERRMAVVAEYVKEQKPDVVVFQEAIGTAGAENGGKDSPDAAALRADYPHRMYIHESFGENGSSYGYWIGAKQKPRHWIKDGFSFPGGVERKVQGALFENVDGSCLGILSLHLSYQNSKVRQTEAKWLLDWVKAKEKTCERWLVVGDFNADERDPEMKALFKGNLRSLYREQKPTIGAFNPIRRIYGNDIKSKTIDWALGRNLEAEASVVLDTPRNGEWVSDHAGVLVKVGK
ncbi:MAG: endonuclease/exonuclease/phosphatase family protein [Proteobacteria bacterium]|nr:MAG: endonuclease/exonuclease/phosphatase family protein [Pseudomonadota bacterium]